MGREEAAETHSAEEWLNDEQMRGRRSRLHRQAARVSVDLLQCAGQRIGIAGGVRAGGVGLIFARTRNSKLNQAGGDGGDEQHKERGQASAVAAIAITASVAA